MLARFISPRLRATVRAALSITAVLVIVLTGSKVESGDLLRGGAKAQAPGTVPVYGATAATTAQARVAANDSLARTTQAMQAIRAMQAAARNLALGGANNLGLDPNHPGQQLPNVPNGLAPGGLVPDSGLSGPGAANPVTTWTGANTPTQTTSGAQTTVNVKQTLQQAILNWQSFSIGKNTTLNIDQSAGGANVSQWIAFNIVKDPTAVPSQILGSIKTLGQIYVINQNGIIFGGSSQVNVHALVASSLPINTNLVSRGLLNNPDEQFLFSQLSIPVAPGGSMPAFNPASPATPSGRDGDVVVQQGATISSPTTPDHVGGLVALIGPNVTNAGDISTPDGQTILAAGNQVGFVAHSTNDPSLRGLDVYVGSVDQYSGAATNSGLIEAPRADVTLAGKTVNQLGGIDSTTSVALNGRVDLLADYNTVVVPVLGIFQFQPSAAGSVTLGAGSVTQILPELSSADRVVGSELALPSLVNIEGRAIHFATNATLLAPGATLPTGAGATAPTGLENRLLTAGVTVNAGNWLFNGSIYDFVHDNGQIYLDAGARIDVAGSQDVDASVTENIVSAQLRGTELANSPLQRTGVLRGQTVQVDILQTGVYNGQAWVGTPLGDVSGYAGLVQHTVGELTVNAGSVSLDAGNSVVMQPGSAINVSGGWINYQGGMVQTTKLISGGHVYDISEALPNIVYDGILGDYTVNDAKWGVTQTFGTPLLNAPYYEAGYIEGGNGGSIAIIAPSVALDGNLLGNTVAGPRQQAISPYGGALSLVFQAQSSANNQHAIYSPTPPAVIFDSGITLAPVDPFTLDSFGNPAPLGADRKAEVVLSPGLVTTNGFSTLTINNSDGSITVPSDVNLALPAGESSFQRDANGALAHDPSGNLIPLKGGNIALSAANIDIEGEISSPGGNLNFTVTDFTPYVAALPLPLTQTPLPDPTRGNFTLGAGASLSTAGLLVNDLPGAPAPFSLPLVTGGGTIVINSYNTNLAPGSLIDVSGGAAISPAGKVSYGNAGSIAISAGQDPVISSLTGGELELGSTLRGYSGGKGGLLSILAPSIQIGGATSNPDTLLLSPDFFSQGGFGSFTLNGLGAPTGVSDQYVPGVFITPGTVIDPISQSLVANRNATGNIFTLAPVTQLAGLRTPVSLSFGAKGVVDPYSSTVLVRGDFVMGAGASIQTDPNASVSISGNTVTVLGSIVVPGGSISISGGKDSTLIFQNPLSQTAALATVDLGPSSVLSTAGVTLLTPDPSGNNYRTGSVLNGGNITVFGNIVAEAGAVLNVSGATDVLDLSPAASGISLPFNGSFKGAPVVSTRVDSSAGSITLTGAQELFTDATLIGRAGGPSAQGGSLTVSSGIFTPPNSNVEISVLVPTLVVTQSGPVIPAPFYTAGQTAIGNAVVDGAQNPIAGLGYFAADSFNASGLDSLSLRGTVQFKGPVTLTARQRLAIGSAGVVYADSTVNLNALYVALGTPFAGPIAPQAPQNAFNFSGSPFYFAPSYGAGNLNVNAGLIDLGNLSLQNIGSANFTAANGDLRGDGTLDIAGSISITAGQVYPATETSFTIVAYDHGGTQGSVSISGAGNRQLPLSAGGELNIYGSIINQGGVLRAPFGSINIGGGITGAAPVDEITGNGVAGVTPAAIIPATQSVTLSPGSVTSVSAVDPITGLGLIIPFGTNLNGASWIDPAGTDITAGGVPGKSINISAANITDQAGATIDLRGGGDLYAYRWVNGLGGTSDILASTTSYAVIPGYQAFYAPVDPDYANSSLPVGSQVYLGAGSGLPAGVYTLLPARYALLPGAFLITPQAGQTVPAVVTNPDGSVVVPGYRFVQGQAGQPLFTSFEVDSQSVVQARAEYDNFLANSFLAQGALKNNVAVPRLPVDSGQLVLVATQAMNILGTVNAQPPSGGLGGMVDISSPVDIFIGGPGATGPVGDLTLDATTLTNFGAASLLIGGVRSTGPGGTTVAVATNNLTVDNAGAPLKGADVILVANKNLTLAAGADVESSGILQGPAETLLLGNSAIAGSGDGVLLRVSSAPTAQISRSGVDASSGPVMTVGAGATISGASVTLDSTRATSLDPSANLSGNSVALDSGQISILLDNPGSLYQPTVGLVLSGLALENLQGSVQALSLLSYTSLDIYGTGQVGGDPDVSGVFPVASLALHAAEIRGFNNGGGAATFSAGQIILDNSANGLVPGTVAAPNGTLVFNAGTILLGANRLNVDQYVNLALNASGGILAQGSGALAAQGTLTITTPLITGATASNETITAGGVLAIQAPAGGPGASVTGGLGASLTLQGSSIAENSNITLPSGELTLHATGGDVTVAGKLDAGGTSQNFFDVVKYTSGGGISLTSDTGNVIVAANGIVTVSAQAGGGDAGSLTVSASHGSFSLAGTLLGAGGAGGRNGTFSLDAGTLPGGSLGSLDAALNAGGFTQSLSIRVRTGDVLVDGYVAARTFNLSTDAGSITVAGTIDASGVTGGAINLVAQGSVALQSGAKLTVAAQNFDDAGKGGAISLEAGSETNGNFTNAALGTGPQLDIQAGSTIDLSVAANTPGSAALGDFTGKLHLRAPQTTGNTDLQVKPINGNIINASSIVVEGYQVFDLTAAGGVITSSVQNNVKSNGTTFGGNITAITGRLLAGNAGLASVLVVEPGAEIINRTGNLTLGTTNSTSTSDWNLSSYRFGPNNAPGVLTLRAAGNLVFYNALSDGFASSANTAALLQRNALLPVNSQAWSYNLTAGADFSAADISRVQSLASLGANTGSLLLGKNAGANISNPIGSNATTATALNNHFQVIRTSTGDINISAGRDVQLLNQFATIYTSGVPVASPTILPGGAFNVPVLNANGGTGNLGAIQENPAYAAQYSYAGGNVTINAQGDIEHETQNNQSVLIPDSQKELPDNWLYRRGYVNPLTGNFGTNSSIPGGASSVESTTWWVDFANFFEGVGALGGGNVTMVAGNDINNVDAVIPTNARMPVGTPNAANLVELGGGDLFVRAGNNLNGGVYYVERGNGVLSAGNSIVTNSTRSPSLGSLANAAPYPEQTWLPTTLFLGKGSFDVSAGSDVLLGPVANPFLLPEGYSNTFWYKTYFSTYAATDAVNVSSLTGAVTLRESTTMPGDTDATPILLDWLQNVNLLTLNPISVSYYQPWLRLNETSVTPFTTVAALLPPTLRVTSFSGDVDIDGNLTLSPSPVGSVDIAAAGSIGGLQVNGVSSLNNNPVTTWGLATINLSDANPASIYGIATPYAYQVLAGTLSGLASQTANDPLTFIDSLFDESGSVDGVFGVLQTKQALHAPGPLHLGDPEPVRIYAVNGDIGDITLYSGKAARVIAGQDITDIALYIQNVSAGDISLVDAGRDIVAYDASSPALLSAQAPGNALDASNATLAGDIQIGGPGTLEVLAGRNLDLGIGPNNPDGTGVGITSIGNARNPYLPFGGADIVAGAGIGSSSGLEAGKPDFTAFISQFLDPATAGSQSSRYLPDLAAEMDMSGASDSQVWTAFELLPAKQQDLLALDIFYLVLRDAGRDKNDPTSPGFGNYASGYAAIAALFPGGQWQGDISVTSREIKTASGGDINLLAPGGQLTVGLQVAGTQAADQGILTEDGGNISIFTNGNVNVGTSRIFTLRGGNEIIWSTTGDIAAGASSKTVQSAPPTRVLIDPQSGAVQTDLAGLATGGGIGVLESVVGVPPGNVDLIAPVGTIDAGDAGIRVSGNLNISAAVVLNAGNIQVGGATAGTPVAPAGPNIAGLTAGNNLNGASNNAANEIAKQGAPQAQPQQQDVPSIITVEVIGYGGDDGGGLGVVTHLPQNPGE